MIINAGIILSGCGIRSGSDPFETAFLINSLESNGFKVTYLSLSSKKIFDSSLNLAKEKLYSLKEISPKAFDLIVIPGGQGVIWNLLRKTGEPKKEISDFLREFHLKKGTIIALSLGVSLLSRVFPEYEFDFDLLNIPSGKYLINKELNFIVSPGSINVSSTCLLQKEIEEIIKEAKLIVPVNI